MQLSVFLSFCVVPLRKASLVVDKAESVPISVAGPAVWEAEKERIEQGWMRQAKQWFIVARESVPGTSTGTGFAEGILVDFPAFIATFQSDRANWAKEVIKVVRARWANARVAAVAKAMANEAKAAQKVVPSMGANVWMAKNVSVDAFEAAERAWSKAAELMASTEEATQSMTPSSNIVSGAGLAVALAARATAEGVKTTGESAGVTDFWVETAEAWEIVVAELVAPRVRHLD
eukprot:gnl/MRDRNA2_/MRDRNA2_35895_c0_seq2.p1 gnl/MRDRNA2_/MRDRNA2_35895_c0~~gnl/MRDRNA2_/MRDRNA2_35895_c0_seq2.p1  ORF type:complete len:233 (-),score=55.82 gnl/MRDRNA2_/MRDRNA2_35895_c0_seq2:327-1025(-)